MESLIFQIILIGVAIGININSEIRDGIEGGTKIQVLEKKKWHRKLSIRLLIFTFCFSIGGQIFDWHSKKEDRKKQKEDYDYSIAKLDTSINKGNNALVFLNNVKASTHLILDSVKRQLDLQSKTILVQKDLLRKNEALIAAQSQIYKNTDAALNPFFPVTMFLDFIVVSNNDLTSELKKRMRDFKASLDKMSPLDSNYYSLYYNKHSNTLSMSSSDFNIKNSYLLSALNRIDYTISFLDNFHKMETRTSENTILSFGIMRQLDTTGMNPYTWFEYDFKRDELHFKQRYYSAIIVNVHATKNITYDILKDLYIRLDVENLYNLNIKINKLELISTYGVARRLNFIDTWQSYSNSNKQTFLHKISDKNIIYNKNFFND